MAIAAALLLSGCAPSTTPTTHPADPSPTVSHPAFLSSGQSDIDRLPDGVAASIRINPDSTRYQGVWDGRRIFLALKGSGSVCLVMGADDDDSDWTTGCGNGDEVVTDQLPDGATAKYLPMVTKAAPQGWTRLSDFVFVM